VVDRLYIVGRRVLGRSVIYIVNIQVTGLIASVDNLYNNLLYAHGLSEMCDNGGQCGIYQKFSK
jgi:hypothetical protein